MTNYKGQYIEYEGQTLFIGYQFEYSGKTVLSGINRKAERPVPIWLELAAPDSFRLISSPQEIHILQLFVMNEMTQKGEIPSDFFQSPDPTDKIVGSWQSSILYWKKEKQTQDGIHLVLSEDGTYTMSWKPNSVPGRFADNMENDSVRGSWRKLSEHLQRVKKPDPYANRDYRLLPEQGTPYCTEPVTAVLHKSLLTHKPALTVTFYSKQGMEDSLQITFYQADLK